jgi:hypothetical protein
MKLLFTALQLLLCLPALGQTAITATYDSTCVAELYDRIPIGLKLVYDNNQLKQTEGFLRGDYRWNRLKITTDNGAIQSGTLLVNRKQLAEQEYTIHLTVTVPGITQPFLVPLTLPHVESIRFNHYADSLKRDIHFYLNVEGVFSSGKIYPLDTSSVAFEVSEGKMIGQDLLIDLHSATRIITVTAVYKPNPAIKAASSIPVKQLPDDMSLIKKR